MATFLAYRIICGHMKYKQVPISLRLQVKQILIDAGCEDLIIE